MNPNQPLPPFNPRQLPPPSPATADSRGGKRRVMGAPKLKWTPEEENALKAGVDKHGAGKWRTILRDPDFSNGLRLRSNVDLKDKWRNMSVTANGWGSREKARMALKRGYQVVKHDDNQLPAIAVFENADGDITDVKPLAVASGLLQISGSKISISRIDNLIVEAITTLKEPDGSSKTSIAMYIEDQYDAPPNFKRLLSTKLRTLAANGKLIKVKRKYHMAPMSFSFSDRSGSAATLVEGKQSESLNALEEGDNVTHLTPALINSELAKIRNMTAQEAAAAAAKAVAIAEAAMLEAQEAARQAETAEADAEAAQAFAEAAVMTLRSITTKSIITG